MSPRPSGAASTREDDSGRFIPLSFAENLTAAMVLPAANRPAALARLIACSLDLRDTTAVRHGISPADSAALIAALDPKTWRRTVRERFDLASWLARAPAAECDAIMADTGVDKIKGKKADKIAAAMTVAASRGWLPPELRTPHDAPPPNRTAEPQVDLEDAIEAAQ